MSRSQNFSTNRYEVPPVLLTQITDDIIGNDENLEPQFVRVRASNQSILYLEASFSQNQNNANNNFLFFTNLNAVKIKRLAITDASFFDVTPNVNIRNNTIAFFRQSDGVRFEVTVPEFYAATGTSLINALLAALNASGSGIVFGSTPVLTVYPQTFTINGSAGFRWDETSSMIRRGEYLINLLEPRSVDTFSLVKTVGPMFLQYTRYIDIISYSLNEYTKNPTTSNSTFNNASLLFRLYFDNDLAPIRRGAAVLNLVFFNFNRTRGIDNIDIRLLDEFGEPFYVPLYITNFDFTLIMTTEI